MTLLKIHQAAKMLVRQCDGPEAFFFETIVQVTAETLEREAARRTSIKRQLDMTALRKRRVIRLPDSTC
jgi:hypothetical protein